jgi:hypothetical protein
MKFKQQFNIGRKKLIAEFHHLIPAVKISAAGNTAYQTELLTELPCNTGTAAQKTPQFFPALLIAERLKKVKSILEEEFSEFF